MGVSRRMLQLAAACVITIAGTTFVSALDESSYRIAMGPTSAPMKPAAPARALPSRRARRPIGPVRSRITRYATGAHAPRRGGNRAGSYLPPITAKP